MNLDQKLVGLSLSQCVLSAVEGQVEIAHIAFIVTSTRACRYENFVRLCREYGDRAWRHHRDECLALAMYLYGAGKIVQPRLDGNLMPAHDHGIWIPEAWKWHLA